MSRNANQHRLIQDSLNYSSGWHHSASQGTGTNHQGFVRERIRRVQRANSRRHSNPLNTGITFIRRASIPLIGEDKPSPIDPSAAGPTKVYLYGNEGGSIPINLSDNISKPLTGKRLGLFADHMKPNPLYVGISVDTGARKSTDGAVTTSASKVVQLQTRPGSQEMAEGGGVSLKPQSISETSKVAEKKTILQRRTVIDSENGQTPKILQQQLSFSSVTGGKSDAVPIAVSIPTDLKSNPNELVETTKFLAPPSDIPPPMGLAKRLSLIKAGYEDENSFGLIGRKTVRKLPPGLSRPENPILPGPGNTEIPEGSDKCHTHRFTKLFYPNFVCAPSTCGKPKAFAKVENTV